jgi:hypothetical protein
MAELTECDGVERSPNPCACPCEGCKYHCSAHEPQGARREDQPPTLGGVSDLAVTC